MPRDGTLSSVSFHISTTTAAFLFGTTITLQARVYRATADNPSASNFFLPIAGSLVIANPPLPEFVPMGTTAQGSLSGLSIPVAAGDRLLLVISAQSIGPPSNTVVLRASGGLGIQ